MLVVNVMIPAWTKGGISAKVNGIGVELIADHFNGTAE